MPDKSPLMTDLFQFTAEEMVMSSPELTSKLIPPHVRSATTTTASSLSANPGVAPPNNTEVIPSAEP
jgi:hypothetical protein